MSPYEYTFSKAKRGFNQSKPVKLLSGFCALNAASITTGLMPPSENMAHGRTGISTTKGTRNEGPGLYSILYSIIVYLEHSNPTLSPLQWQGRSPIFRKPFLKRGPVWWNLSKSDQCVGRDFPHFIWNSGSHIRTSAAQNQNIFLPNIRPQRRDKITQLWDLFLLFLGEVERVNSFFFDNGFIASAVLKRRFRYSRFYEMMGNLIFYILEFRQSWRMDHFRFPKIDSQFKQI